MKTISIVTISYGHNYGNKLQNYAMQKTYESLGLKPTTIKFIPNINKKKKYAQLLHNFKLNIIINKLKKKINYNNCKNIYNKRISNFEKFNKLINFSKEYDENNYYKIADENFDYYSVGSDQVWNTYFADFSKYYLLDFIPTNNKIAYAPSFGSSSIDKKYELDFKHALSKFKVLSCREEKGANLIYNLVNKKVPVLVDPTMLLSSMEWDAISELPIEYINKKYIVIYFLGNSKQNEINKINSFAKKNNCEIVNLLDSFSNNYSYGPSEFLGLIKNAYAVFTDSFHASLFSIIYKKPFLVFGRVEKGKSMSSRIDTLLEKFDLQDRKYINNFDKLFNCNYENVERILKIEKEKSIDYIKMNLNI